MVNAILTQTYQYQLSELDISPEDVYKMARMDAGMLLDANFLRAEIEQLQQIQSIKGQIVFTDQIELRSGYVKLNNVDFNVGKQVAHYLRAATSAVLFICTAGFEVSVRSKELMAKGDLLEGFLVDCLGSIIVEKAMDKIQAEIADVFRKNNKFCSNRYSPGYCEWSVEEQKKLFAFFLENCCGIKLSESCLMSPVKSISGVIGIGSDVKYLDYKCDRCNNLNCVYRNNR